MESAGSRSRSFACWSVPSFRQSVKVRVGRLEVPREARRRSQCRSSVDLRRLQLQAALMVDNGVMIELWSGG